MGIEIWYVGLLWRLELTRSRCLLEKDWFVGDRVLQLGLGDGKLLARWRSSLLLLWVHLSGEYWGSSFFLMVKSGLCLARINETRRFLWPLLGLRGRSRRCPLDNSECLLCPSRIYYKISARSSIISIHDTWVPVIWLQCRQARVFSIPVCLNKTPSQRFPDFVHAIPSQARLVDKSPNETIPISITPYTRTKPAHKSISG